MRARPPSPLHRLELWPAAAGSQLERLVLVASEHIPAGREVRFDYVNGARRGTYWGAFPRGLDAKREHHRTYSTVNMNEYKTDLLHK